MGPSVYYILGFVLGVCLGALGMAYYTLGWIARRGGQKW